LLALIRPDVSEEAKSLSDDLEMSVVEVLVEALALLRNAGIDKHRSSIRQFWQNLTPEQRRERASRAAKQRWAKANEREGGPNEEPPRSSAKKAGT
jgi:hypothetical protein